MSDDKTGALRLVTYDDNGCVDFLSDQFPEVGLYMFQFFVINTNSKFAFVECEGATELEAMRLLAYKIVNQCYEAWEYEADLYKRDVTDVMNAENITAIQELIKSFQIEIFSAYDNQVSLKDLRTPGL